MTTLDFNCDALTPETAFTGLVLDFVGDDSLLGVDVLSGRLMSKPDTGLLVRFGWIVDFLGSGVTAGVTASCVGGNGIGLGAGLGSGTVKVRLALGTGAASVTLSCGIIGWSTCCPQFKQ